MAGMFDVWGRLHPQLFHKAGLIVLKLDTIARTHFTNPVLPKRVSIVSIEGIVKCMVEQSCKIKRD